MPDAISHYMTFRAMGCTGTACLCGPELSMLERAAAQVQAEVQRIESKYSRYLPESVTSRLRAAAGGDWLTTDAETDSLLNYAHALWQQSDGLFDITAGVLRKVWDFQSGRLPEPNALQECLAHVGWARVQRRPGGVCLPSGTEIDFGGIGKEYAADRAAAIAASVGVTHGWINLGGDIAVIHPVLSDAAVADAPAHAWQIGIAHPRPQHPGQFIASVSMARGGLATSGDNERYMEVNGTRYCHILNPRTGWPVTHWQSVSVVAASATAAGSLSTIAMLKEASAMDWLSAQHVQFLAVDFDGRVMQHPPGPAQKPGTHAFEISLPSPQG